METDDGFPPSPSRLSTEEEKNVAYRPPIKEIQKRLDTRPSTSDGGGSLRDTADYKRITKMITELVDMRARMNEGTHTAEKLFPSAAAPVARNTVVMGDDKRKNKKKKKDDRGGTAGPTSGTGSLRDAISTDRQGRNIVTNGRRDNIPKPSSRMAPKETWATVVRKRDRKRSDGGKMLQTLTGSQKQ